MADPRIDIWNILHDGSITAVDHVADVVRLFVSIGYLRRLVQPLGGSFVLELSGVTRCEFRHFDGETTSLAAALEDGEPEILSTSSEGFPVTVHTTLGTLELSYAGVRVLLDTGQPITIESIAELAREYWRTFDQRRTEV